MRYLLFSIDKTFLISDSESPKEVTSLLKEADKNKKPKSKTINILSKYF